jgi:flagellar motor switch protein FliN/FliY
MAEHRNSNEAQPAPRPEELHSTSVDSDQALTRGVSLRETASTAADGPSPMPRVKDQPAMTPSVGQPDTGGDVGAPAAAETPSPAAEARETRDAQAEVDSAGVSAGEAEAAMQEMLEASEKPATDDVSGETTGTHEVPVSSEEVDAIMQEVLTAAERPEQGRAGNGPSGSPRGGGPSGSGRCLPHGDAARGARPGTTPDAAGQEPAPLPDNVTAFQGPDFSAHGATEEGAAIDLLDDVELDVKIELGRTEMYIEDVLALGAGSVVALDKAAGDPVDIFVNDRLVARGEVLVLNDNFCVRINDILSPIPELEREE